MEEEETRSVTMQEPKDNKQDLSAGQLNHFSVTTNNFADLCSSSLLPPVHLHSQIDVPAELCDQNRAVPHLVLDHRLLNEELLSGINGESSLLIEQGVRPNGLFAQGDRFIPCRPEEAMFAGEQKFYHEENLLLSRQAKKNQRRQRRNTSMSDGEDSDTRSRDSSRSSNESNSNRSDRSETRQGRTHASR